MDDFIRTIGLMIRQALVSLCINLMLFGVAFAAPSVNSVAGTIANGESVVISSTGTDFGTGPTIHKWDDFEGVTHTVDQTIGNGPGATAWTHITAGTNKSEPKVSNTSPKTNSTKFIRCEWDFTSNEKFDCRFHYEHGSELSPVFLTFYLRWDYWGTYVTNNEKFFRICYTANRAFPYFRMVSNPTHPNPAGSIEWDIQGGDTPLAGSEYKTRCDEEEWVRFELYGIMSDKDVANGAIILNRQSSDDGLFENLFNETSWKTRTIDDVWDTIVFGDYVNHTGSVTKYYHDFDDIYIASSRARVEIGDASVWANCTHREIQVPSAWAADEITVTLNQGSFADLVNQYLFVVDADGNVSPGYQLTGSCGNAICDPGECLSGCTDDCAVVDCCGIEGCNAAIGETAVNCAGDCDDDEPPAESGAPNLSSVSCSGVTIN